jgi:hypothetical protein
MKTATSRGPVKSQPRRAAMKPSRESGPLGRALRKRGLSESAAPFVHQPLENMTMPDGSNLSTQNIAKRANGATLSKLYADYKAALAEQVRLDAIGDNTDAVGARQEAQKAIDAAARKCKAASLRFERAPVYTLADVALKLRYAAVDLKGLDLSGCIDTLYPEVERMAAREEEAATALKPSRDSSAPDESATSSRGGATPAHENGTTPIDAVWLQEQAGEWAETFAASSKPMVSFGEIYAWGGTDGAGREDWQSEPLDIPRDMALEMMRWLEAHAIEHSNGGAARPAPSPATCAPRDFVSRILAAMHPLTDADGEIGKDVGNQQIAEALAPLMGHFTVYDAVLMMGTLGYAQDIANSRDNTTLSRVWFVLRDFVCSAEGTSPACGAARVHFLREECDGLSANCRKTVFEALRSDVLNFSLGRWDGLLFGGRNANPEGPFAETPWWTRRGRLLSGRE